MVLAAAQRLRQREEFAAIIRRGRRTGRNALVVHLITRDGTVRDDAVAHPGGGGKASSPTSPVPAGADALPARAGFVVSRAVGTAVIRNQVRRRLRHLVRDRLSAMPAGTQLVVRALPAAAGCSSTELGADLDAALAALTRRAAAQRSRDGGEVR